MDILATAHSGICSLQVLLEILKLVLAGHLRSVDDEDRAPSRGWACVFVNKPWADGEIEAGGKIGPGVGTLKKKQSARDACTYSSRVTAGEG